MREGGREGGGGGGKEGRKEGRREREPGSSFHNTPFQANHNHLFLQGCDRLYLNSTTSAASHTTGLHQGQGGGHLSTPQWKVILLPSSYLVLNWPVKVGRWWVASLAFCPTYSPLPASSSSSSPPPLSSSLFSLQSTQEFARSGNSLGMKFRYTNKTDRQTNRQTSIRRELDRALPRSL